MDDPISVVIADDHLIVRRGLQAILEEPGVPQIQILGEADRAETALALVEQLAPRVLITDLKLGASFEPGLSLIQQVRRTSPHTEVLVLTGFDESDQLLRAIRAGASGCISKADEINGAEIRSGIAEVARGRRFSSPIVYQRIHALLQTGSSEPLFAEKLTSREEDVLDLIAAGMSNQAIAARLSIGVATVKSHVSNILAKLQVPSRELAVLTYHARQAGG
jgi:NarL family two-component system response regulator LiaR